MGKTRQRQLVAIPGKDNNTSSRLVDSSNANPDLDLYPESSWVIVKKQRVTILVPSLPVADRSPLLNLEPSQPQTVPSKRVDKGPEFLSETCPGMPRFDERRRFEPAAPKKGVQLTKNASAARNFPTLTRPLRQDLRMESVNLNQFHVSKSHKLLGVSKSSRTLMAPRLLLNGHSDLREGGMPLNQRLRALNLERKLQKAGGLSRWLTSLGLGQFVRIFQRKGLSKFQLVNLNMKKLKDMGANAVGPRRKLMHAIDCICQPYCFEAFSK